MNALLLLYVIGYAASLVWAARLAPRGDTSAGYALVAVAAIFWPAFLVSFFGIWMIGVMTTQPSKDER